MSSIVPITKLTRQERWMLGENVVHACKYDGQDELAAVNRSLAAHNESVDSLLGPPEMLSVPIIRIASADVQTPVA